MTKKLQVIYLILAAVIGHVVVKAQLASRPDMKNLRTGRVLVDIDSPETHQSQYHTADFDRRSYNYGYEVSPDGQFHHETRGPDGVTYGCYGYIDQSGILRATHYVADSQGYRTVEPSKPVLIYPNELYDNTLKFDSKQKRRGRTIDWQDLYFPIGCGMVKGGVPANVPLIKEMDGSYTTITRYSTNSLGSSVIPTNNQPIQTEQFNGNQFNNYNSDSNSGQYNPNNGIGAIPLGSNAPTTYNPNYNEYQQQVFTDDVKDLHYEHTHGGHQTEFTISSGHAQSMSSGQQQGSGNSAGQGSGNNGSGFGGQGIPHGGDSPFMSGSGSNSQSSSSNNDGSGNNYHEYHSSSSSSSSSGSTNDGSTQGGSGSNFMGSQPGSGSSFSQGGNSQPQQQQQSSGEQYGSSWNSGSNQYQHNPAPAVGAGSGSNSQPAGQSGQSSSGHSGSGQSSSSQHGNQHGSSFQHTHGHPSQQSGGQSGHGSSSSHSQGSGGSTYYPQNQPSGSHQSGGMMSQSQGGESGSQQGQFSQTGGNDPNNFQSSGSNNPPQQQGGSGFSQSSQHGNQNQMSSGGSTSSSTSSSSSSSQSGGGNTGPYEMSSQGGSSGSNNGPYQNPVNGPHGQGFSPGHGHPVPQPGHGMMPSNSGSGSSQPTARPMMPSGGDPQVPSRPMHSGGSQSQGQTPNRPSPPSGSDPSRPMQSGGGQTQTQTPNRPSGGDPQNQTPNRPSPSSGSDPSRPMQSGGGQTQTQTPNRPSGGDPQSQSPGRPTQTHPTRPGRPPVTQQQPSGQGSSQQSQQPTQRPQQSTQQPHQQPQQQQPQQQTQQQGSSSTSNQNQQPQRPQMGGMTSGMTTGGSSGNRPTYPPRPPQGSGTYFNGDDQPGATAIGVHPPLEQQKPYTDSETPEPDFPFYNDPNYELAISRWPLYVVPLPLDFLQNALQGLALGGCCGQQQQQANQENIQGSGQGQQSGGSPVDPSGSGNRPNIPSDPSSGSGSSQQSSGSGNKPTQGEGQGQGQGQQSSQANPSNAIQQMMQMNPNGGVVGFIPIVFFPCNGTQGNGNQYPYGMPIAPQGGSNGGGCQPCANAAQQRSNPVFGAISNAKIFHNSDFNSVTQIRRTRQRKAKIDAIETSTI